MAYDYDITVIGGGPGGYVAAIKAAQEGRRVCLVEGGKIGGVCLHEGCIPTKTLLKTANLLHEIREAERYAIAGVDPARLAVSMPALQKRKQSVVGKLAGGVRALLRGNKVTLAEGFAAFADPHTVTVNGTAIRSEFFIIATGSSVLMPPSIKREGAASVITSKEALELDRVPASIVVIGGGAIGIEFAYLFNRLGSTVTVLELMDHILPAVDEEVSSLARKRLTRDGVTIRLGARVHTLRDNQVLYEMGGVQASVEAETVLMAVGRAPAAEGLNARGIGLEFDRDAIKTDAGLRTSIPHIYAIGDVNGRHMLAHTASHEAVAAVENILGRNVEMRYNAIPSCIYLDPEIACIGLTEKQAREQRASVKTGTFPMAANGKSLVEGDADGMMKVIVDGDCGEILGVHLYGKHVTDMIAEMSLAMSLEAAPDEVIRAVHPHPTISEALPEAFMAVCGKAIHSL